MTKEVKLSHLREVLDSLDYPITQEEVREAITDTRLLYADGEEELRAVISRLPEDRFDDVEDLESEIYSNLPVEAVGEPGQSEGEG